MTESACIDKVTEFMSEFEHGNYFYDLIYLNAIKGTLIELPRKASSPILEYFTGYTNDGVKHIITKAMVIFLKRNRPSYIVDALVSADRLKWCFV